MSARRTEKELMFCELIVLTESGKGISKSSSREFQMLAITGELPSFFGRLHIFLGKTILLDLKSSNPDCWHRVSIDWRV